MDGRRVDQGFRAQSIKKNLWSLSCGGQRGGVVGGGLCIGGVGGGCFFIFYGRDKLTFRFRTAAKNIILFLSLMYFYPQTLTYIYAPYKI